MPALECQDDGMPVLLVEPVEPPQSSDCPCAKQAMSQDNKHACQAKVQAVSHLFNSDM